MTGATWHRDTDSPLRRTLVPRPQPLLRYSLMASIVSLFCSFIMALGIGIDNGDFGFQVGTALLVTSAGVAGGLLLLYLAAQLVPRSVYSSSSTWKPLCASYLPYLVSGMLASVIGLSTRMALPGDLEALAWWEDLLVIGSVGLTWLVVGGIANRWQDSGERIQEHVRGLEAEIVSRRQVEDALQDAQAGLERRVEERTAELSASNELLAHEIAQRQQAEEKLQDLYAQEKELRERLEQEMKRRIEFTRALVHELKTPLTPIVASSQLLAEELDDGTLLTLARNVSQGASNLNRRIDELLDVARGELGVLELKQRQVEILKLLGDVVEEMAPMSFSGGQSLALDLPAELPAVWADEGRLRQVLLNLLGNALKWTPRGGTVTVRARQDGDSLVVEIQDTGAGITSENQQHLFEPYYRVEKDRQRLDGLGLGLSLCKRLVERHGGRIWVKSRAGGGSTFGFSLPLGKPDDVDPD